MNMNMKLKLIAAVAAAVTVGAFASSAMAEPVMVKLVAPAPSGAKLIAGGAVFECLGDVCAARMPGPDSASVPACKEIARQVGSVVSFGPPSKPLSPTQLTSCNLSAKK